MEANKDYTRMSLEELVAEEKKARKEQTLTAVMMGFMLGVLAFGVATQGFRLVMVVFPIALFYVFFRSGKKTGERLAAIRAELGKKRAG
ncbi:MAG: hypothetical protein JNL05_12650 [Flavobacteriales bacterium]|nr:hypothetical protein [Flavobacteriales bacterium]